MTNNFESANNSKIGQAETEKDKETAEEKTEPTVSEEINNPEKQSQDELREANIVKRVDNRFADQENNAEYIEITKKIVERIKNLPDEVKEDSWQSLLQLVKSESMNDIYFYKELHDDIIDTRKNNQKDNELKNQELPAEERLSKCSSFKDLDLVLDNIDSIEGSEKEYDPENLKRIIEDVKNFRAPLNTLTRSAGLRDKVKYILSQPEDGVAIVNKEIKTAKGSQRWQTQYTPNPDMIRLNKGNGWDLIDKEEYKKLLRETKEENIGVDTNLWNLYKKEIVNLKNIDLPVKDEIGEKMNETKELIENKYILEASSLSEVKENLEILYKQTDVSLYKNLLDYIDNDENNFAGNQESPLFKKILELKEKK